VPTTLDVLLEEGDKRCFARVLAWPGWCRSGRDEASAVDAVLAYRDRYALVARRARLRVPATPHLTVVERLAGSASTDFGVPGAIGNFDRRALRGKERARWVALLEAAWSALDDVAASSAESLRKGPRGGGRDRTKMINHVLEAEAAYGRSIGVRIHAPAAGDTDGISQARQVLVEGLSRDGEETKWPLRYFVHRAAWHVLDHAWEMEDRQP